MAVVEALYLEFESGHLLVYKFEDLASFNSQRLALFCQKIVAQ